MKKRILDFIRKYRMISPGDRVCVGFSGGADSVCLLEMLFELKEELSIQMEAVHVNHNLRGAESDGDQKFAEEFCLQRGIPLHLYSCPVAETAEKNRWGLEEAGRFVRGQAYEECRRKYGADKIALAHHQNDLAETFLFHLSRGTSLEGLAAVRPVRGDVIRPLLCVTRAEIEAELRDRKISWRTDSSNLRDDYTRNCIRHQVIPVLEEKVNPRTVAHVAAAGADLMEAAVWIRSEAEKRLELYGERREKGWFLGEGLTGEIPLLSRTAVLAAMEDIVGSRRDIGREHIEEVRGLFRKQTGKRVSLPGGLTAVREYDGVLIADKSVLQKETPVFPEPEIRVTGEGRFRAGEYTVDCSICKRTEKIPEKTYTKWMDYDRISNGLVLRTRRAGDYLIVNHAGGRRKLKDYMIDEKIPRNDRDSVLLLASGQEIFWVIGYRISESCKVREDTQRVMRIQITGGNVNER